MREFESIGVLEKELVASVTDPSRLQSVCKLVAYVPFRNAANALENMCAVSEGLMHDDLRALPETSLPTTAGGGRLSTSASTSSTAGGGSAGGGKSLKSSAVLLGVADTRLSAHINEQTGLMCLHSGAVPEIVRGLKLHADKLIQGLGVTQSLTAQRALAHSYSRAKVKFNVNRIDNMIIQSIALLDQIDKDINTFTMRIREWYSYHFPELVKLVPEPAIYCRVVDFVRDRTSLTAERVATIAEIVQDEERAKQIHEAAKSSMGLIFTHVVRFTV